MIIPINHDLLINNIMITTAKDMYKFYYWWSNTVTVVLKYNLELMYKEVAEQLNLMILTLIHLFVR